MVEKPSNKNKNKGTSVESEDIPPVPEVMQDDPKLQGNPLVEIDISYDPKEKRPVYVSSELKAEEKEKLVCLLKQYHDVFAWTYQEMLGLDETLVTHKLSVAYQTNPKEFFARNSIKKQGWNWKAIKSWIYKNMFASYLTSQYCTNKKKAK